MDYPDNLVLPKLVQDEGLEGLRHEKLPPIRLQFFVPRLSDKPQDPIVDTLKHIRTVPFPSLNSPDEFHAGLPLPVLDLPTTHDTVTASTFWKRALDRHPEQLSHVKSWDSLRSSFDKRASSSPFLSEQATSVFASARKVMDSQMVDTGIQTIIRKEDELLLAARSLVIGNSSRLFQWDTDQETFNLGGIADDSQVKIIVDGWDTTLLTSYLRRFINIGCALRRLDVFIDSLRESSSKDGPTIHSFSHALLLVVDIYREKLAASQYHSLWDVMSSRLWAELQETEEVLLALATMCGRPLDRIGGDYLEFSHKATALLSTIHNHLQERRAHHASRVVVAVLSYILTSTSTEYFASVGKSVSYKQEDLETGSLSLEDANAEPDFIEDDDDSDKSVAHDVEDATFPAFFPSGTIEIITRARVSLQLLRTAEPDHPLLHAAYDQRALQWVWTVDEVEALAEDRLATPRTVHQSLDFIQESVDERSRSETTIHGFDPVANVLDQFRVFDLDPGDTAPNVHEPHVAAQRFIDTFPDNLPPLTPTLSHLFDLVISPLLEHCNSISSSLLKVTLSPSRALHLPTHLRLVRDYLLLTSPTFKRRLGHALLSDSDNWEFETSSSLALAKRSSGGRSTPAAVSGDTWAVGLGLGLVERTSWPPGGSDLSYYLRTVIVDSLELPNTLDRSTFSNEVQARAHILTEAEFRLGFSIRDLPTGAGRDRWLDPCSIEALDFLLMTYKAPAPLDVVITDNALSKCQRIFTFAMRLLRVQYACNALHRMTRDYRSPLFETHAVVNRHLLHFRFMAHNFVETLVSYVFDVAIRGNYDAFIDRLEASSVHFSDISAVAEEYSGMLDNILSACLLRSSQRAISDLLRGLLELVLDFCTLCGEMRRSNLEEYKAVPIFEEVFARYRRRMSSLVNSLRNIVEKQSSSSYLPADYAHLALGVDERFASGATGNLHQLLMRLDVNDWISSYGTTP